ncbi:MAG: hypothetical protein NTW79_01440 [Candidatus Berkelbacteria bacterium]|nr:hypothetical protein [Candidatus Berkelbacteria bacterium]
MKIWGIVATVLLIVAIGLSGWLYVQNNNLKSQKNKVETDLSSMTAAKAQSETKRVSAGKKLEILSKIFANISTQDESLVVYDLIKSLNDDTLTADFKAMQNSKPGDTSGSKMITDLLLSATSDLK